MRKNKYRVLIIDDDAGDVRIMREMIRRSRRCRFEVDAVESVSEAYECFSGNKYDAYLVDYYLGEARGLDLIHQAHYMGSDAPIIVITGLDDEETDEEVMFAGAHDYLPKGELSTPLLERSILHAIERTRHTKELERLASLDALTQLANRAMFDEALERAVSQAKRQKTRFAVLLLDLDRFKEINDTMGHHIGDSLLVLVGTRLQTVTRKEDIVARVGGDEFTILINDVTRLEEVKIVADKVLEALQAPTPINNGDLVASTSIGIAMYPESGDTPITIMQNVDLALYKAKALGRNNYQFFTPDLQENLQYEISLEKALRNAISLGELYVEYQCKVDMKDLRIIGFEALLRWDSAAYGLVGPDQFIPIAEKTGLIDDLGQWVFESAVSQLKKWRDMGFVDISMAVNVSAKQIETLKFVEFIKNTVYEHDVPAEKVDIEITEAVFFNADSGNVALLQSLRDVGVEISIDDFGTGFSSLSYIKDFPVTRLKIDKSFISSGEMTIKEKSITQAITMLGKGLGMKVTAEGVESWEQFELLAEQGCHEAQGYLFSKPLSYQDATRLLQQGGFSSEKVGS